MHLGPWFTNVSLNGCCYKADFSGKLCSITVLCTIFLAGMLSTKILTGMLYTMILTDVLCTIILTGKLCTIILIGMRVLHKLRPTFLS